MMSVLLQQCTGSEPSSCRPGFPRTMPWSMTMSDDSKEGVNQKKGLMKTRFPRRPSRGPSLTVCQPSLPSNHHQLGPWVTAGVCSRTVGVVRPGSPHTVPLGFQSWWWGISIQPTWIWYSTYGVWEGWIHSIAFQSNKKSLCVPIYRLKQQSCLKQALSRCSV